MAQTYKIKDVKKGNTWKSSRATGDDPDMQSYALVLEGVGEPVQLNKKMPVKTDPQVGDELTGDLEEQERNGRVYYKFKVDYSANKPANNWKGSPKDDKLITASWAIGQSVQVHMAIGATDNLDGIEVYAKDLAAMAYRIKETI